MGASVYDGGGFPEGSLRGLPQGFLFALIFGRPDGSRFGKGIRRCLVVASLAQKQAQGIEGARVLIV